ncbi:hypothetical protein AB836_01340 [Rickettsiales bacterium (ex Bugula neritina AB1)]|nr:hypothetical protein AB836_01340 [Rickettsiales bacterium (ex Bugula neritina AB1)]
MNNRKIFLFLCLFGIENNCVMNNTIATLVAGVLAIKNPNKDNNEKPQDIETSDDESNDEEDDFSSFSSNEDDEERLKEIKNMEFFDLNPNNPNFSQETIDNFYKEEKPTVERSSYADLFEEEENVILPNNAKVKKSEYADIADLLEENKEKKLSEEIFNSYLDQVPEEKRNEYLKAKREYNENPTKDTLEKEFKLYNSIINTAREIRKTDETLKKESEERKKTNELNTLYNTMLLNFFGKNIYNILMSVNSTYNFFKTHKIILITLVGLFMYNFTPMIFFSLLVLYIIYLYLTFKLYFTFTYGFKSFMISQL